MTHRFSRVVSGALLALVGACSGESTKPSPVATSVSTTSAPAAMVVTGASAGVFAVKVLDASATPMSGVTVMFTVTGSGSASPASVVTDSAGVARTTVQAGTTPGALTIVAAVTGTSLHADASITVVVGDAPCTTLAPGVATNYGSILSACITGTAASSDYLLVAYNGDTLSTNNTMLSVTGAGTPPSSNVIAPTPALAYRGASGPSLVPDVAFHTRMREQALKLASLVPAARQWQAGRQRSGSASSSMLSPSGASYSTIPSNPALGDVFKVNVDVNGDCTTNDMRPVRVMSIGTKSIVLADTANPSGGFTQVDYDRFAARFDTLVYPLDVNAFGAPSDIDNNGKVVILFTRAVNEATAAGSNSYIAGFFADRDLFPRVGTARLAKCATSNEAEMFYMLAPDPAGTINGNVRPTSLISGFTTSTLAHEFQHLINASRRLYVNNSPVFPEVTWLNEGLSHVTEELLYYRETGKQPRQNLTDANIRVASASDYSLWKEDLSQNFQRYNSYLSDPGGSSPRGTDDTQDDALSTRGGTWSFLRYSADRFYTTDGDVWFRLVNSTTSGLGTLRLAFGNDMVGLFRDWTLANYLDDSGFSADPAFQQASWNFRDIYTKTFVAGVFPLKVTGLTSGASVSVSVKRNSASYYRLSVPASGQARINFSATGTAPAPGFQFVVVRTR